MPLTDREIKTALPKEKNYKLSDEKGLFLQISSKGSKLWRIKYRFEGKEKLLSIGVYPEVSLKVARQHREDARNNLANGIDPSVQKQAKKHSKADTGDTLEVIAREWLNIKMLDRSEGHRQRILRNLERDIFPELGSKPITSLTPANLLEVLRKVEERGAIDTAHRERGYLSNIFQYGVATSRCENDPAAPIRGAMRTYKGAHFSSITDPKEVGRLLCAVDGYGSQPRVSAVVVTALKCSALWLCRQGELRYLNWDQVNWEKNQIETVSVKTKTDLIIPLAKQSLELLTELKKTTGHHDYIFPSARGDGRPLSENGVRVALRSMGYTNDDMTPHGFRAMGRTLLDEVLGFPPHIIEQQLAHAVKDPLGRAYNRTQHLDQRRVMMQKWADYLDKLKYEATQGNVISANFKQA